MLEVASGHTEIRMDNMYGVVGAVRHGFIRQLGTQLITLLFLMSELCLDCTSQNIIQANYSFLEISHFILSLYGDGTETPGRRPPHHFLHKPLHVYTLQVHACIIYFSIYLAVQLRTQTSTDPATLSI